MSDQALTGIRVLDLTRLLPFGYGTQLLVDAGAEVVKVESPGGEDGRGMPSAFRMTNRGKRSIELDLHDPSAVEALLGLATSFDVIVESFRPGFLDRLGAGYDAVAEVNPAIVYCSATGFASEGPHAHQPGHDLNYAAVGGLVSAGGGAPSFPNTPYIDMVAGWGLFASVLLGLVERGRTSQGSRRTVSMADLALSLNVLGISSLNKAVADLRVNRSDGGSQDLLGYPWPALLESGTPCYGLAATKDGRWLALANIETRFWHAFLEAIGRPDLRPFRFATGERAGEVRREIQRTIGERSRDEWMARFATLDVCVTDVLAPAESVESAEYAGRGIVSRVEGEWIVSSPLSRGQRAPHANEVPWPGQHDDVYLIPARSNCDD